MRIRRRIVSCVGAILGSVILCIAASGAHAAITGMTGPNFNLTAKHSHLSTPDGGSILFWGYAPNGTTPQYPGPTLIVNEGDTVNITLNVDPADPYLGADNVSIVFPGQTGVTTTGGVPGIITTEADGTTSVTYTFTASNPGTYLYHSGTQPELQVEMGLFGALIVRPLAGAGQAYNTADTSFDREVLFLLSEMDPTIHQLVELGLRANIDNTTYKPVYWFINGRAAPDTMLPPGVPWLPTQPYNCMPRMMPGETLLMRVVNAGRDLHPFHHHGNHSRIVGKSGMMLESSPGLGADLSTEVFTIQSVPGETVDALFTWTGQGLGWDIYGDPTDPAFAHDCIDTSGDGFDDTTMEYCADHGKPFPVILPETQDMAFGGFWSGSPFLGSDAALPPGEGGLNPNGGFTFMWHSHNEKEMANNDIFPGGMMTMLMIEPPGTVIDE